MLTKDDIQKALPPSLKTSVNDNLVNMVNNMTTDPVVAENLQQNFLSYARVLVEGKFKTTDYLNAVTYATYKMMDYNNQDAYAKTFPQRFADLVARNVSPKDIASYVSAYSKNKLVRMILEQSLIPVWLHNYENYQKAINVQVDLMYTAKSEKVRSDAANSILTHLAKPKDSVTNINLGVTESSGLNELTSTLEKLAKQQIELMNAGVTTKEITESKIIDGEYTDG